MPLVHLADAHIFHSKFFYSVKISKKVKTGYKHRLLSYYTKDEFTIASLLITACIYRNGVIYLIDSIQ